LPEQSGPGLAYSQREADACVGVDATCRGSGNPVEEAIEEFLFSRHLEPFSRAAFQQRQDQALAPAKCFRADDKDLDAG